MNTAIPIAANTLRRQDIIEYEPLLKNTLRAIVPFASYSLSFPSVMPEGLEPDPDHPLGRAVLEEDRLMLPLSHGERMLAIFAARGVDPEWVRNMYSFAIKPDAALYFRVPLDVAVERITAARASLKYYEAGVDLNLSDNIHESFKLFQGKILDPYDQMVDEFGLTLIDGPQPVKEKQKKVRVLIKKVLRGWEGLPNPNKAAASARSSQPAAEKEGK